MGESLRRLATVVGAALAGLAVVLALGVWFLVHERVAMLRAIGAIAAPVPPNVRNAIVAAEDPYFLRRPAFSLRALLPPMGRTLRCGPSPIAYVLVRSITRPRRGALWQLDVAITAYVVSRLFTPDELLRIYAHLIYFGTIDGHDIRGVAAASTVYFRKPPRDLTLTEAATLAGMIRSPNALSPIRYPERAHVRRDFVLAQMLLFGFIDEREYRRAVGEGVRAVASPAAAGRTVSVWRTNPSDAVHAARGTWVANDRRVPPVSKIQPLLLRA